MVIIEAKTQTNPASQKGRNFLFQLQCERKIIFISFNMKKINVLRRVFQCFSIRKKLSYNKDYNVCICATCMFVFTCTIIRKIDTLFDTVAKCSINSFWFLKLVTNNLLDLIIAES